MLGTHEQRTMMIERGLTFMASYIADLEANDSTIDNQMFIRIAIQQIERRGDPSDL